MTTKKAAAKKTTPAKTTPKSPVKVASPRPPAKITSVEIEKLAGIALEGGALSKAQMARLGGSVLRHIQTQKAKA